MRALIMHDKVSHAWSLNDGYDSYTDRSSTVELELRIENERLRRALATAERRAAAVAAAAAPMGGGGGN
eukprot:COSAG05_NODE_5066_length_1273_cov_1.838160_1_plen_69_part_00